MCKKATSTPYKTIPVEQAVGLTLAHDMTEVIPGKSKGPAFRKGHRVRSQDLCRLMKMGKNHLYVLDLKENQVHEDQAVFELASALSGPGVTFSGSPKEGKLELRADYSGLFKINREALVDFNMHEDVMCACIHNNTVVKKGQSLAGTRAIPLIIDRDKLNKAVKTAKQNYPVCSVKMLNPLKVRLVITGNEVYKGLVKDRFRQIVEKKVNALGATLEESMILPDDRELIARQIRSYLDDDTDLIITTGGMSVDPDDVTKAAIEDAGFDRIHYSAAVLPGAMFLLGYHGNMAIMGVPACGLYHEVTVFDLVLPRIAAGEKPDRRSLAELCHGGLCMNCDPCRFPVCPFGKA